MDFPRLHVGTTHCNPPANVLRQQAEYRNARARQRVLPIFAKILGKNRSLASRSSVGNGNHDNFVRNSVISMFNEGVADSRDGQGMLLEHSRQYVHRSHT